MPNVVELSILTQDEDLVAVNKPAGLLVHRSGVDPHATEFALQILRDQLGAHVYPVHRLDRPTSGALLFARSSQMARALAEQFARGSVTKTYLAIVRGVPTLGDQVIDYPLREELDRLTDARARVDKPAQEAVTQVSVLGTCELPVQVDRYPTTRYALVRARPLTGRKHQIRRHLRHIGHPILGDVNHGVGKHNRFFESCFGTRRLWLACTRLEFAHPRRGTPVRVDAPLAPEYQRVVDHLGWRGG